MKHYIIFQKSGEMVGLSTISPTFPANVVYNYIELSKTEYYENIQKIEEGKTITLTNGIICYE